MDPISASCYNLQIEENARKELEAEERENEKFSDIIVSIRSISKYESKSLKSLFPQIAAACIAASLHIVTGIGLAYSAILVPHLNLNASDTDHPGIMATKTETSWIASTMVIVGPIGGISAGFIMDSIGRLNMLKLAAIPGIVGWIIIAMAQNVPMLIVGRMLTGISSSWGTNPAVVYTTEIARVDIRGSLTSFGPAFASLGMVIAFLKGWCLDWRIVAWMCIGYTIIPIILIQLFIPESPAWLVSKGRIEEAAKSLRWIHRNQPQPEHRSESIAELTLHILQKEHLMKLEKQSRSGTGFMDRLRGFLRPTGYKPLIILFGLFFFQQFSGIYVTLFYSITFFEETGSSVNAYLASTLIGAVRFAMSCVNTYMLRTFSRRPLIMASGVGMSLCMLFSGLFTMWIKEGTSTQNWVPTVLLLLYVITSMIGLLPIPWTITAELFPIEIRGIAHSFSISIANSIMFASIQLFFTLEDWFGGIVGVQWFFAVICILASVYTFIFLPETHGKKLTEITNYFENSSGIYLFSKKKTDTASLLSQPVSKAAKKEIVKTNTQSEKLLSVL